MIPSISTIAILAETHMAEVSLQYRDEAVEGSHNTWFLMIPVVAIVVAYAIYRFYNRMPSVVNTPTGLLTEVCAAHGLGGKATQLLQKIARAAELPHPATILMSQDNFENTITQARRRVRFGKSEQKTLGAVRRNVFAK